MTATTSEHARRLGAAPDAALLDPAERMGIDELRALQLERLQWTLRHAYDNVPHYRAAFDAAGVHPDDCRELADLAKFPTTAKADLRDNYPFGMFAVPQDQVRRIHASSGTTGRPTVGRLHRARHRHVGHGHGPLHPGGRRAGRGPAAQRLRLRPVHRRAGCPLRRREARLHRHPDLRRHDPAPGAADPGLRAPRDHGDAVLHAHRHRRDGEAGHRPALHLAGDRHLRRRAVDRADAPGDGGAPRHRGDRHLRPVRGHGARRRAGVRGDQGRPAHLGGPLLSRRSSTRSPGRCCRRARRASWSSPR